MAFRKHTKRTELLQVPNKKLLHFPLNIEFTEIK